MATVKEISEMLASRAETVAKMLLPHGKQSGREWGVGSLNGEAGNSLKVCIAGSKQGVWSDFQSGEKGDLLDLWRMTKGLSMSDTVKEAKAYLGIVEPAFAGKKKEFTKPAAPKGLISVTSTKSRTIQYLTEERKLTPESLSAYKVGNLDSYKGKPGPWIVFGSMKGGKLTGIKYLHVDRPEGKKVTMVEANCEPSCFGWHAIPDSAREVTICEGELDCITMYQYGWPAVSVPFGGGGGDKQQWVNYDWELLETMETIYLCLDSDAAGQEATKELIKRLGEHRCKIVTLPKKDANECLMAGITKEVIDACFKAAKHIAPDGLKTPKQFEQVVLDEFYPTGDEPLGIKMPWAAGKLRFRPGELTIWTGWSGHRKSMVLNQIVLACAAIGNQGSVLFSMEMAPRATLKRAVQQACAELRPSAKRVSACLEWMSDKIWLYDKLGTVSVDEVLKVARYAHKRFGIKHVVIDSMMRLGLAEDDLTGQSKVVQTLVNFALETGVHVHLVAHARKRSGSNGEFEVTPPDKQDIRGSQQLTDNAFNVIICHKNVGKERALEEHKETGALPKGCQTIEDLKAIHDMLIWCQKSREQYDAEVKTKLMFDWRSCQAIDPGTEPVPYFDYSVKGWEELPPE